MDRLDVILDYFMDFNLDPDKNQKRVEYTARQVLEFEPSIIKKACDFYAGSDNRIKMPNVPVLVKKCKEFEYDAREVIYDSCDICGGEGYFLGVYYKRDEFNGEVTSYDHDVETGDYYFTSIRGRCSCRNGVGYGNLSITKPPQYIKINDPDSLNLEAGQYCLSLNKKSRELENE